MDNAELDVHPLSDDAAAARKFADAYHADHERAQVHADGYAVELTARGSELLIAIMRATPRTVARVLRAARVSRVGKSPARQAPLQPLLVEDSRRAREVLESRAAAERRIEISVPGERVLLNERGSSFALSTLTLPVKRVRKIAAVLAGSPAENIWSSRDGYIVSTTHTGAVGASLDLIVRAARKRKIDRRVRKRRARELP